MTKKKRRRFTPDQKVAILKKHLVDRIPVSDICDELKIHPTQFYLWQKTFFESGHRVFERTEPDSAKEKSQKMMSQLKDQMKQKDGVIAELLYEHFQLKKSLGEE
jgi:transposase-like protein